VSFSCLVRGNFAGISNLVPLVPKQRISWLPRLNGSFYTGRAFVHWSMAMDQRATGWLTELHYARLRELLCHALSRYDLVCPVYCLMPDHAHFLFVGCGESSDQRLAVQLFRKSWNRELRVGGFELQKQAFDHVLRDNERERDAFTAVATYISANPVRAELVPEWKDYPYLGALVPGYPDMDLRGGDFWDRFWRVHATLNKEP
jgi:putative transposase